MLHAMLLCRETLWAMMSVPCCLPLSCPRKSPYLSCLVMKQPSCASGVSSNLLHEGLTRTHEVLRHLQIRFLSLGRRKKWEEHFGYQPRTPSLRASLHSLTRAAISSFRWNSGFDEGQGFAVASVPSSVAPLSRRPTDFCRPHNL